MSAELFRRRTALWLVSAGGLALAVTLFAALFWEPPDEVASAGADTFSRSALGYRALAELLGLEVPVVVSRQYSAEKASPRKPLLLLEPGREAEQLAWLRDRVASLVAAETPVVLVLPKWRGEVAAEHPGWVERVRPVPLDEAERTLAAALAWAEVERVEVVREPACGGAWTDDLGAATKPDLPQPQLLVAAEPFEPVVACGRGLAVARVGSSSLYVVSDPDLLNNGGLARGGNAVLAHRLLIDALQPVTWIVDESQHGYRETRSVWRVLLEFPLALVTAHLVATGLLVWWAGARRFGSPLPVPPRVAPGKRTLIEETAKLLRLGRYSTHVLRQYSRHVVRQAARPPAPGRGSLAEQTAALADLGRRRGATVDLQQVVRRIDQLPAGAAAGRVLSLSAALHRFRKEIVDGPRATA